MRELIVNGFAVLGFVSLSAMIALIVLARYASQDGEEENWL